MQKIRHSISSFAEKLKSRMLGIFKPDFLKWLGRFLLFAVGYTIVFAVFFSTLRYTWPYLLALLIAWMMRPLMRFLTKRLHWKNGAAAICMLVLVVLIFAGIISVIVWRLVVELIGVIEQLSQVDFVATFNNVQSFLADFRLPFMGDSPVLEFANQYKEQIDNALSALSSQVSSMMASLGRGLLNGVASVPTIVMSIVVMFFAAYYFGRDWEKEGGWKAAFQPRAINQARHFYQESVRIAGNYLGAYFKLILITFAETIVIFLILGVPYALLFAFLAGIFDVMPLIGVSLVYIPLIIYFVFQGAWFQVIGLIIGLAVVTLVRQVLEPKLVSRSIDVHPLLMVGIFLLAMQLGNLWVMVFLTLFVVAYKIMVTVGMFAENEEAAVEEKEAES